MPDLHRVELNWSGVNVVGLAKTILHFDGSTVPPPDMTAIRAAFATLQSALPVSTVVTFPGDGVTINDADGTLSGTWSFGSTPAPVSGSSTDTSAAGVGACVTWSTGAIVGTRRLRGRTFIVPLSTFAYDQNGTITPAQLTALGNFRAAMLALSPDLMIWHRPTTPGGTDGSSAAVNGSSVRDRVAYLGSRRS